MYKLFLAVLSIIFTISQYSDALIAQNVKLTEVDWQGTGCYKIEMGMGTVYFEKDNGVSGFKSFVDPDGNDWIASYLPPGPNGDFRGFPNSVGNFGHAGRDSGSKTTIVDGKTEGDVVVLESSNQDFTFQYWFFTDRVAIKVLRSKGEYCFLLECVAGGSAEAEDFFVTADGKQHLPTEDGAFDDFTPEWFYLGDPKSDYYLFLAKTPDDDAPNENHRQIRKGKVHNMDLYSFGRTGQEHKYEIRGMSGNEHVCIIGFHRADRPHNQIAATVESFMEFPFTSGVRARSKWSSSLLKNDGAWFASDDARSIANSVIQYQSPQGGWPKSTDLARPPLTKEDVPAPGTGRANSLDNDATTVPMQFLARMVQATGEEQYQASFERGLEYLFDAQYPNGGWPQFWPLRGDAYYSRITYNDGAMIRVMQLLRDVAAGKPPYQFVHESQRKKAAKAIELGLDCILKSQIRENGKLKVWCAQHDEKTLAPAWARAYEPPSFSGSESVGIVRYLMSIDNPSQQVIEAVEGAVEWLRSVPIIGMRLEGKRNPDGRTERFLVPDADAPPLWARFYELGTDRPLYLDRDSKFRYNFAEISYERRSGYGYHGYWPQDLLDRDYPVWKAKYGVPDIYTLDPATIAEAEAGTFTGTIDRHSCGDFIAQKPEPHSGFTGEGYVDSHNKTGSYIEVEWMAPQAGEYELAVRYVHGKSDVRPAKVEVNGTLSNASLPFTGTDSWTAWSTQSTPVQLQKGKNVVRLTALGPHGLVNIDHFSFRLKGK